MLQCYALSKVLTDLGHNVELLRIPIVKPEHGFIGNLTFRIGDLFFNIFRRNRLPHQVNLTDCQVNKDDIYIVGSDQVWNPDLTGDRALDYFFNFLPNHVKRISYAASFGTSEWPEKNIETGVRNCLNKFSAIGVRESSGVQICKEIFNVDATLTIDPTLLLDNYDALIIPETKPHKKTLVVFSLLKTTHEWLKLIQYIAKQTNTHPVMLSERRIHKGISYQPWVTVEKWLSQIANSTFVITNSFHGTVFAIIFKKQFIAMPAHTNRAGRIKHLLEMLGLETRYFKNMDVLYNSAGLLQEINYEDVFKKLSMLKLDSMKFLTNGLR